MAPETEAVADRGAKTVDAHTVSPRELVQAKVRKHMKAIADAKAEAKEAMDEVKSAKKTAEADGLTLGVINLLLKMADWTPGELRVFFSELREYAQAMGYPTNSQGDLFEAAFDEKVPQPAREELEWGIRGFKDGVMGRGNPEEPGNECPTTGCRQEYGRRWLEGQEELMRSSAITADAFTDAKH